MNILDQFFVTLVGRLDHLPASVAIWQFFTHCAEWGTIVLILYLLMSNTFYQWQSSLVFFIGLVFLLLVIEGYLKPLIGRPRPFITYDFIPWVKIPRSFSMPSGHSATAFYTAAYAIFCVKKYPKFLITMAAIAAASRIYLGVHYLTDVIAGSLLGLLTAYLFYHLWHTFSQNKSFDIY